MEERVVMLMKKNRNRNQRKLLISKSASGLMNGLVVVFQFGVA